MASITIRRLDERVKNQLRVRAAEHGRSMEEEARSILRDALDRDRPPNLADLALELFGAEHGVNLEQPPPVEMPEPPKFE
jgi:antitoxin FitA